MLNIPDPWVSAAFVLCLLSSLLCVVWGALKWNESDQRPESDDDVRRWAEEEDQVEKEL